MGQAHGERRDDEPVARALKGKRDCKCGYSALLSPGRDPGNGAVSSGEWAYKPNYTPEFRRISSRTGAVTLQLVPFPAGPRERLSTAPLFDVNTEKSFFGLAFGRGDSRLGGARR